MLGEENVMLFLNVIIGFVFIVEKRLLKYITKDMQKRILAESQ
mgnify:CR=1 FL=1